MVGEAHSLKVEKVLFQGKSDYQNVMVFQVIVNCYYPFACTQATSSSSVGLDSVPLCFAL
jgi:spermidine synthase